ncbi:dynein light intermediate chain [Stagonosporopsis vannaccii]|nr:dynein light intermediate chain [Stagonosporopsis vannaccii]
MASARRASGLPPRAPGNDRPSSRDADREELWKPMLDSISSGKRLPEKSLLVLGGTPDTQRDFLDALATDGPSARRPHERARKPPVANHFALGYTYQDVLDTDHEGELSRSAPLRRAAADVPTDTLARLSLYLLASPSPSFTPLVKPYLTPRTIPHTLVVVLLDWNHPWLWIRQLRDWIRALRSLIVSLDDAAKDALQDNMAVLQDHGRRLGGEGSTLLDPVQAPRGPGEWDEELGLPLCVVCQNADKIESLEKERGWKEDEFDFILQYLRTILLKHGGSLIYTMPSAPGSLQTLIHSTLGIRSLLKQEQLRHNVTDRDRVLVPPNWDSWGKIRVLRGDFAAEEVSQKWSVDIDRPQTSAQPDGEESHNLNAQTPSHNSNAQTPSHSFNAHTPSHSFNAHTPPPGEEVDANSATAIYEKEIRNPESDFSLAALSNHGNGIEVTSMDPQVFLTEQVHVLDQLRQEDDKEAQLKAARKEADPSARNWVAAGPGGEDASGVVEEHIGPVQFNMGGIHVNADEMVKRLQDREASRTNEPKASTPDASDPAMSNDKLMSFFSGLINKGANSPARGS